MNVVVLFTESVAFPDNAPGLAKVMDRCTLVRSLAHTITAHGPGTVYMATGNRPGRLVRGAQGTLQ